MAHDVVQRHDGAMVNRASGMDRRKAVRGSFALHGWLLAVWFAASFGVAFFAHDLQMTVAGWPVGYWFAAQGSVFIFIVIVAVFAWIANRREPQEVAEQQAFAIHKRGLHRKFATYIGCLLLFLLAMTLAEQWGLNKVWIGGVFLVATVALYAAIGIYGRTSDAAEYYVAGRSIPAVYNGMATAADWMSAASFISMAGGLYLQGFSGTESQTGGLVLRAGLDRWILSGRAPGGALFAAHGAVYGSRLLQRPLWRPLAARDCRFCCGTVLFHLRGGTDLRRRPDHVAPDRCAV